MTAALALQPPSPPRTRAECQGGPRPCPWDHCRHHLGYNPTGETCTLDRAERGTATYEEIGQILGLTRQRVLQIELVIIAKLHNREDARRVACYAAGLDVGEAAADAPIVRCGASGCVASWCAIAGRSGRRRQFCSPECRDQATAARRRRHEAR